MPIELRDRFAMAAMKGLVAEIKNPNELSIRAYKVADAMLRARSIDNISRSPNGPPFRISRKPKAKMEQLHIILKLKKQGLTNKQIADRLGVNGQSINGFINWNKNWGSKLEKKSR